MKFITSELLAVLSQKQMRQNVRLLGRYLAALAVLMVAFSVLFHVLMRHEGQQHSWLTGMYWTFTVMTTLGFGDITFQSDIGRAFTILVLGTGVILLLIVMPYAFIRHFYAPWLEAQLNLKAPRTLPEGTRGHVIFCHLDDVARTLMGRLKLLGIPFATLEPDPIKALAAIDDGHRIVLGNVDESSTYRAVRLSDARLLVANLDDRTNTNITLTARELCTNVPIVALADDKDAVDILHLAGATQVFAYKHRLGEQLAAHVSLGHLHADVVGRYRDLVIAEVPVHGTRLQGVTVAESRFREITGLSIVAYWERGHLGLVRADTVLSEHSVVMIAGTEAQIRGVNELFGSQVEHAEHAVVVIGGGKVGRAASRALSQRGLRVNIVEQHESERSRLATLADRVVIGNAADIDVMTEVGIGQAPSVLLTTSDDATNIYLAVYCRKLNPDCRIISRIAHDRNLEAIHRAGADFVLSEAALAAKFVLSVLHGREVIVLGEDVDVFVVEVPASVAGQTLAESGIGAKTGLCVLAIQQGEELEKTPTPVTQLPPTASLVMMGTLAQREAFTRTFR